MGERLYLSPPDVGPAETEAVLAALDSGWITTLGPAVTAFEGEMAAFTGVPHAVALASGTAALHLALLGLGVGPGDEVLVSTMTFAATANAVRYCGADPVFLDSDRVTWNLDPTLLEDELRDMRDSGRRPGAVVAVDVFGHCADYDAIVEICQRYEVPLVEDAAESLGAAWSGAAAGSFGAAAILSFNGNKIMTTSGGGILLTHDQRLAAHARHLATQAREPVPHYEHREVGYNYRLSNLLAALGSAQLRRLPAMIERRQAIRHQYVAGLQECLGLEFQPTPAASTPNAWLTTLTVPGGASAVEALIKAMDAEDVELRHMWKPMHQQPVFAHARSRLNGVADHLFEHGLCLPSGSAMTQTDVERVLAGLRPALEAS